MVQKAFYYELEFELMHKHYGVRPYYEYSVTSYKYHFTIMYNTVEYSTLESNTVLFLQYCTQSTRMTLACQLFYMLEYTTNVVKNTVRVIESIEYLWILRIN
jgi:hypothetical protein